MIADEYLWFISVMSKLAKQVRCFPPRMLRNYAKYKSRHNYNAQGHYEVSPSSNGKLLYGLRWEKLSPFILSI